MKFALEFRYKELTKVYFSVPNKHPWTFNLNKIFFSTQRQLVILDI